jgi:hypothetical protein
MTHGTSTNTITNWNTPSSAMLLMSQTPAVLTASSCLTPSGGGTTTALEFFPDNPIEQGTDVTNISTEHSEPFEGVSAQHSMAGNIEQGMKMTNITTEATKASEGMPTQHSAENSGVVDGDAAGAGTKKPSKMRPGNTLTPR